MSILLAPGGAGVSSLLVQNLGIGNALTAWSGALLNTSLYPLDPKPAWYDPLNAKLQIARTASQQWVETDGPNVLSQAPQSLIDFGNLFAATAADLQSTLAAIGTAPPSADHLSSLVQDIQLLIANAQTQSSTAATLQASVAAFAASIQAQRAGIEADVASASATLQADEETVTDYQDRIAALQAKLGIDTDQALDDSQSAAKASLSLFGSLFVYTLAAIATDGASLPLMAVASGAIGTSAGGAGAASADESVQSDLAALGVLETQLTAEDQQVAGLQAILGTLHRLDNLNSATGNALDALTPLWDDITVRLQFVAEELGQPSVDVTRIDALTGLADSIAAWSAIVAAATNVQSSTLTVATPVSVNPTTAARLRVMDAPAPVPSLVPDVAGTQTATQGIAATQSALLAYARAVGGIQTEPQAYNTNGISGTVDPCQNLPAFKAAVLTAQSHTYTYVPTVVLPLAGWATETVPGFSGTFSQSVSSILATAAAIGTGTASAAQQQTIADGFASLVTGLQGVHDGLQTVQSATQTFAATMPPDLEAFVSGQSSLANAITTVQNNFTNQELSYAGTFGGEGIIAILGQIEQQVLTPMLAMQQGLGQAIGTSQSATASIATLLDLLADLNGKYAAVATFVAGAEGGALAGAVERIDLHAANAAWQQLTSFIQQTISGVYEGASAAETLAVTAPPAPAVPDSTYVAPDGASNQNLADTVNSMTAVTGYANAIANIVLLPATTPPADWFPVLSGALVMAQSHCQTWVEVIGPNLSSGIPQTLIDYGNFFAATTQDILSIVGSSTDLNAASRQLVLQDIDGLLEFLATESTAVATLHTQLKQFQSDVLADHTALSTGTGAAQKALNLDEATIATINSNIAGIQAAIATASTQATYSEIGIGLSIFVGLCAVTLAVATGGAGAVLVGCVAVAGFGAAIDRTVAYNETVTSDLAKLQVQQNALTDDQAQATALSSIVNTTQTIVTANEAASAALDTLETIWTTLTGKLTSVQKDLIGADKAADGKTFAAHTVRVYTNTAVAAWNQLIADATNVQTALVGTTVTSLTPPPAA
jgi:Bacillus haemolytic enterotoxin (HBL)